MVGPLLGGEDLVVEGHVVPVVHVELTEDGLELAEVDRLFFFGADLGVTVGVESSVGV